jgi:hypothetical protein
MITKPTGIDLDPGVEQIYNIEISALSGTWREYSRRRWIDGHIETAKKVVEFDCRYPNCEGKVKRYESSPGFPVANGEADWSSWN